MKTYSIRGRNGGWTDYLSIDDAKQAVSNWLSCELVKFPSAYTELLDEFDEFLNEAYDCAEIVENVYSASRILKGCNPDIYWMQYASWVEGCVDDFEEAMSGWCDGDETGWLGMRIKIKEEKEVHTMPTIDLITDLIKRYGKGETTISLTGTLMTTDGYIVWSTEPPI